MAKYSVKLCEIRLVLQIELGCLWVQLTMMKGMIFGLIKPERQFGLSLIAILVVLLVNTLGACTSAAIAPVQPALRVPATSIAIEAAPDANPDPRGRPSPVVLRIYELDAISSFNSADFVGLFEREQATLGTSLLARQELQLTPGQSSQSQMTLKPGTRFIAVAAAFRDLERANWRATLDVQGQSNRSIKVRLTGRTIRLEASQ
jgi:type VI secretion system protein VasD